MERQIVPIGFVKGKKGRLVNGHWVEEEAIFPIHTINDWKNKILDEIEAREQKGRE